MNTARTLASMVVVLALSVTAFAGPPPKQVKLMPGLFGQAPKQVKVMPGLLEAMKKNGGKPPTQATLIPGILDKIKNQNAGKIPNQATLIPGILDKIKNKNGNHPPNNQGHPGGNGHPGGKWWPKHPHPGPWVDHWGFPQHHPQGHGGYDNLRWCPPHHSDCQRVEPAPAVLRVVEFVNETPFDVPFRFQGRVHTIPSREVIRLELPHPEDLAFRAGHGEDVVYREIHAGAYRFVHTDHEGLNLLRID